MGARSPASAHLLRDELFHAPPVPRTPQPWTSGCSMPNSSATASVMGNGAGTVYAHSPLTAPPAPAADASAARCRCGGSRRRRRPTWTTAYRECQRRDPDHCRPLKRPAVLHCHPHSPNGLPRCRLWGRRGALACARPQGASTGICICTIRRSAASGVSRALRRARIRRLRQLASQPPVGASSPV